MCIQKNSQSAITLLLKKEKNCRMKLRLLAVSHFIDGKSRYEIARFLKVSRSSVNSWISNYLSLGVEGLKDKKHSGRPMALNANQLAQLREYLNQSLKVAADNQFHGSSVQFYILVSFGVMYEKTAIYRMLNRLGYSLKGRHLQLL